MSRGRALALGLLVFLGALLIAVVLFSGNASAASSDPLHYGNDTALDQAKVAGNCTGSGTEVDPYVFQDYVIDCNGYGYGIWLKDTTRYVEIVDCTFSNSTYMNDSTPGAGVVLQNCSNVTVIGSVFLDCERGINVHLSENCTVAQNDLSNASEYGLYISDSYWVVTELNVLNDALNPTVCGICVQASEYVSINDTEIVGCIYGIFISDSAHVIIDSATLYQQDSYGIWLTGISEVDVAHSYFSDVGQYGYGIYGSDTSSLNAYNNIFENSGSYGIALNPCDNVTISDNTFNDTATAIYISDAENITVEDNLCTNSSDYNMRLGSGSSWLVNGYVRNNTIRDAVNGAFLQHCENVVIIGNNISITAGTGAEGFYCLQCQGLVVEDNLINMEIEGFNKPLLFSSSTYCQIVNNTIEGMCNVGIDVSSGNEILISGNSIDIIGAIGINLYTTSGTSVLENGVDGALEYGLMVGSSYDLYIFGNALSGFDYGIYFEDSYETIIESNDMNWSEVRGIYVSGGGASSYITICDNFCINCETGIVVSAVGGVTLEGNDCSDCTNAGIVFSESTSCYAGNNTATNCGTGVALGDSLGCVVNGGNFSDSNVGASVGNEGGSFWNVIACNCDYCGLLISNAPYTDVYNSTFSWNQVGISVYLDEDHSDPIYIENCLVENNTEDGLDAYGGMGANIFGNHFANNQGYGVDLWNTCESWYMWNNTFLDNAYVYGIDTYAYQAYDSGLYNDWFVWEGDRYCGNGWSHLPNVDLDVDGYVDNPVLIGGSYDYYYYQLPYGPKIEAPGAPTGLTGVLDGCYIYLNWTAPSFDGNASLMNFYVYMGTAPGALEPIGDSYGELFYEVNNGLTNGNIYYFAVKAENIYGFIGELSNLTEVNYTIYPDANYGPFVIHSDQEFADMALSEGWAGDGSEVSPYIVENLIIDGSGWDDCVEIWHTTVHFVIRNCTFYFGTLGSGFYGVDLLDVVNGKFDNCTFAGEMDSGLYAEYSQFDVEQCAFVGRSYFAISTQSCFSVLVANSTFDGCDFVIVLYSPTGAIIKNNTFANYTYGVYVDSGDGLEINGNTALGGYFIDLSDVGTITIDGNQATNVNTFCNLYDVLSVQVSNNTAIGIGGSAGLNIYQGNGVMIEGNAFTDFEVGVQILFSQSIQLSDNSLFGNYLGLYLGSVTNGLIEGNNVSGNDLIGMQLDDGISGLTVTGNVITNNIDHGVYVDAVISATFTLNMFQGNNGNDGTYSPGTVQAYDKYWACQWSSGGYGNFWAEWTSPDADQDGIVDQPYGPGEGQYLDYAPLAHAFGVPTSLRATVGSDWVNLTWDEVSYDFTSGVDGYEVYRSLDDVTFSSIGPATARHFNDTGLTLGTTYYYRVAALRGVETGGMCPSISATPCNAPGAPTGLTVSRGIGSLELSWTAPTNDGGSEITGYAIWRGTSPSTLTFLVNTTGIGTTYLDGPFGNGDTYYYAVRAINQAGAGTASATVGNTTFDVPSAPQNVDAQFGNHNVTVSWDAPSSDGGTPVTGYVVEFSHSGGAGYYYPGPTVHSLLITGLANGVEYGFRVRAVNNVSYGDWSAIVHEIPATVPGMPEDLTAVPGNSSVSLSWQLPSDDGGDAPASYKIYRMDLENDWALLGSSAVRSYVDSTAVNGVVYYYRVSAVNKAGEGSASDTARAVPGMPTAPSGLTATNDGGKVRLNWTAPADDGGSDILDYKVYRDGGSGYAYLGRVGGVALTYLDGTATPGVEYSYCVSAVTARGEGAVSGEAVITLPLAAPEAPIIDSALQDEDGVHITWHVPESSTEPDEFMIYRGASGSELELIAIVDGDMRYYLDIVGEAGMFYAMRSSNENGVGDMSTAVQAEQVVVLLPGTPTDLEAVASDSQVSLDWDVSEDAVGYYLHRDNGTGYVQLATLAANAYIDHDVVNGVTYTYFVVAFNGNGTSGNSSTVMATPGTVPGTVQSFSLVANFGSMALNWSAPADDGGSDVLGYRVYRNLNGTTVMLVTITALTYADYSVITGYLHTYWIVAVNAWGVGAESEHLNATPLESVWLDIPAPSYLLATVGDGTVVLGWDPMDSLNVDGFLVFRSEGGNFSLLSNQSSASYVDTNVTNGVTYTYMVRAYAGTVEGRNRTVSAMPGTVPDAPELTAQSQADRVVLSWDAPEDGGSAVLGYNLYRTPGTGTTVLLASVTGTVYQDLAVLSGVNYTYYVTALNAFGESLLSNTKVGRIIGETSERTDVPDEPTLSSVTGGNTTIVLVWTAPTEVGDGPLTGFNVYRSTTPLTRELLVTVPAGTTSYTDSAVTYGKTYYYWVSALNEWGESDLSSVLSDSLVARSAPGAPTNITAEAGQGRVTLTWNVPDDAGSSPVTEYYIYRSTAGGERELIAMVPAGTDTFVDASVEAGVEYSYWVVAVNAAGEGPLPEAAVSGVPLTVITGVAPPGPLPLIAVALGVVGLLVAVVAIVLVFRKK